MSREDEAPADPSFTVTQDENPLLWALQQYQKVIRHWIGDLTAVEFTVLMQIVDRTAGWQNVRRTIGINNLLHGGRHYVGIGNAVKRSALMNALRSLEDRGIIERNSSPVAWQMKEYRVNFDWQPSMRRGLYEVDAVEDLGEDDYVTSLYDLQNQSEQ